MIALYVLQINVYYNVYINVELGSSPRLHQQYFQVKCLSENKHFDWPIRLWCIASDWMCESILIGCVK